MANFIKTYKSFTGGEIAPEFFEHDEINGLARLENMDVLTGGGLRRRRGLMHMTDLADTARLIPFVAGEDMHYVLVLENKRLRIFNSDGNRIYSLTTPWDGADLARVQYAQRFGTMIFVHPDYPPQIMRATAIGFELVEFSFARNDADMTIYIPFMRFDDSDGITISVSTNTQGNNFATFKTNENYWTEDDVGGLFELLGNQWTIMSRTDAKTVVAHTNTSWTMPSSAVSDWREAAFSKRRGWPTSITFHQDRLVFGGSKSWPGGVWMSQVGRHNNFDVGTGLDDEAIFITLLSGHRQQICTVVSSDNLQIMTTAGEWAVSNKPLTPSAVDIKQHTDIGSIADRYIPPQRIDGSTIFISGNGRDLRELSLDELGERYNANDLCVFAKHMMCNPVDMAYSPDSRQLFVVMQDGSMAVLNRNASTGLAAWARYTTNGRFQSVACNGGETYVAVVRNDGTKLEKFSDAAVSDSDDCEFKYCAAAVPLMAGAHDVSRLRLRKIVVRMMDSRGVCVNGQRISIPNDAYDEKGTGFTGDGSVNMLGICRNNTRSPWVIHGDMQLSATILSVRVHGYYTV